MYIKTEFFTKLLADILRRQFTCVCGVYWEFEPYELQLCIKFNIFAQTTLLSWGRTDRIVRSEVQYAK